ncbi:alanine racemase [Tsuneonella sp. HG222]
MTGRPSRTLRLRLDRAALANNWTALDRLSGAAAAGAAVKADGYGLGAERVVPVLRDAGCRMFYVAHWSEVEAVLHHVPAAQVAVLHGPLSPDDVDYAIATGVRPVINSLHQARLWTRGGRHACDLMLDTGINRLGVSPGEIGDEAIRALEVQTLMSHLASADEDSAQNDAQRTLFEELAPHVPHRARSIANSAGIALGRAFAYDLTRPGLALYGGIPRGELASLVSQVAFPQAAIIQLRDIQPGDRVGYNATWTASRPIRAATVSVGYADGFLRCWSGKGVLLHGDRTLPIVGRVSMDMVVVDCTAAPELREGDWLDLMYDLPQAAEITGLSQYELLTSIGSRYAFTDF